MEGRLVQGDVGVFQDILPQAGLRIFQELQANHY